MNTKQLAGVVVFVLVFGVVSNLLVNHAFADTIKSNTVKTDSKTSKNTLQIKSKHTVKTTKHTVTTTNHLPSITSYKTTTSSQKASTTSTISKDPRTITDKPEGKSDKADTVKTTK